MTVLLTVTSVWHQIVGPLYPVLDWPMNTGTNGGYNFFSGIATGCIVFGLLGTYYQHTCHFSRKCLRWGHHPVDGAAGKVCHVHHTTKGHRAVQDKHPADRLARGETVPVLDTKIDKKT